MLYGPGSDADDEIGQSVVCPDCNQEHCPATASREQCPSWNVFSTRGGAAANPPPTLGGTASTDGAAYDEQEECGMSCTSQRDCGCGDYLCLKDTSVIARLRDTTMSCVFVPLSSQAFPTLDSYGMKRGLEEVNVTDTKIAERCVCNGEEWGPHCCGEDAVGK